MAIKEYKCPCCGGAVSFDSTLQKVVCPYCDTEFEMDSLSAFDEELNNTLPEDMSWENETANEWQDGETDGMRVYVCKSCGGEIVGDENTAATSCPYCGNPIVLMGQFTGYLKPDYVIPFKLDKEAAKRKLNEHLKGKRFLPRVFKDENHIDEIKGIYVPFWLFDADAHANMRYRGTRVRTWSDAHYNYTETSFYSLIREGSIGFDNVPVDGSSKMPDDLMESIEPFDMSQAVDFQTAYLAGYLADKYDVDAKQSVERANARIKASTEAAFAQTTGGYMSVTPESSSIRLNNGREKYALYPVWLLNTTWNGNKYTFAMNGQTGKFVGDLPVDKGAYFKWLFGLTVGIGAAIFALSYLVTVL